MASPSPGVNGVGPMPLGNSPNVTEITIGTRPAIVVDNVAGTLALNFGSGNDSITVNRDVVVPITYSGPWVSRVANVHFVKRGTATSGDITATFEGFVAPATATSSIFSTAGAVPAEFRPAANTFWTIPAFNGVGIYASLIITDTGLIEIDAGPAANQFTNGLFAGIQRVGISWTYP